jgi:ribosomal protein S18 acetylase RimI-like enzyme
VTAQPEFTIDTPRDADRTGWGVLYAGYRAHYGRAEDGAVADTVWAWLNDVQEAFEGRVARTVSGEVVGLVHFRALPRPLDGRRGGYIDDIFVAEHCRGGGVADALVGAVAEIGRARGWADIRWITAEDNARARGFYDRIATVTAMRTYEIKLPDGKAG